MVASKPAAVEGRRASSIHGFVPADNRQPATGNQGRQLATKDFNRQQNNDAQTTRDESLTTDY
jgi:hypothetical protein